MDENQTQEFPVIVEAVEVSENTIQSLRVLLIKNSENHFVLYLEGLKSPSFVDYEQLGVSKMFFNEKQAYGAYYYLVHQLSYAFYV